MFAVLGDIEFNVLNGPDGMETYGRADYAELPRIGRKPRLQYVGDALDEIRLDLSMHTQFCSPDTDIERLRAAKSAHTPMALVMGNGVYKGEYVITDVSQTARHSEGDGTSIYLEAQITLREFAGDPAAPPSPAVVPAGTPSSVGTVQDTAVTLGGTGPGSTWSAIQESAASGMAVASAAARTVANVQSLGDLVASGDTSRILGRLPGLLTEVNESLPSLGLNVARAQQAATVLGTTSDAARIARQAVEIQSTMSQMHAAGTGATAANALDKARALLGLGESVSGSAAQMQPALQHATAQVATRGMTP